MNDSEALKSMGENLKALRKAAGFRSAKAFAEHCGLTCSGYTSYEQGKANMPITTACVIADALGVSLDELIGHKVLSAFGVPETRRERFIKLYDEVSDEYQRSAEAVLMAGAAQNAEVVPIDIGIEEQPRRKQA